MNYKLELKQIVEFPRCRIYRDFIQTLITTKSIRTTGGSFLFYYLVLCSYANYRTSYRRMEHITYRALEILQQILFFREFDIPLKEIKAVLENPALERNQILQMQRKMLVAKKERMEHLIASIDDILKGENKMDFAIFSKTEVEEMFQTMFEHMPDNMKELAVKEFGSIEEWKKHYIKTVSSEEMQKGYAKVVEWYGGKEQFLSVANNPISKEAAESYNQQFDNLLYKLAAKKVCSPDSSEVRELVSEYGFLMKQLSQIKKEHGLMVAQAQYYRNEKIKPMIDEKYGNGTAEFFAQAFEAFYKDK